MRNTRTASRLLALALTVLMLASCFVALPAMAEETAATTTGPKVLWEHNFADDGAVKNNSTTATDKTIKPNTATDATYPNGYFQDADVFYMDASGTGATQLSGGYFTVGGATYITGAQTTGEKPNNDFFSLLNGQYAGYKDVGDSVFFEFDFRRMYHGASMTTDTYGRVDPLFDSSCTWSYIDENGTTITSEDVASATLYTDHGGAAANGTDYTNSYVFFTYSNDQKAPMFFRMAENGMIYTTDNYGTAEDALAYGGVYYFNDDGEKVYLPATATVANLNLDGCIKDPSKAHMLEYVTDKDYTYLYRVGVSLKVAAVDASTGMVTMEATVYIKRTSSTNTWDKCVGTTTYYYYPVGSTTSATEARNKLQINGTTGAVKWGGDCKISSCNGDYHVSVIETVDATDSTQSTCKCAACGETWPERDVDGLRYRGVLKGNACEGTYYVWVPKDTTVVGVPFADSEYTTKPTDHTYDSNSGLCSVCGKYEFEGELSQGFYISGSAGSKTALQSNYVEDATRGGGYYKRYGLKGFHIFGDVDNTVGGGSAYKLGNLTKPFTVSFDLKVDSVDWNTAYSGMGNFKELITLVNRSDKNSQSLLDIGKAPDGTNILVFRYDFTYGETKEKEDITVGLVRGDDGSLTVDDEHDNYGKLMQWFTVCAAPGQNINTAESGLVTDGNNNKVIGYNYFTYTQDETALTRTYTFHDAGRGLYEIPGSEWFNLKLTFVPDNTGSNQDMLLLYINGELVGMRPYAVASSTADADWQSIRVHDVNNRFTIANLNFDNVGFRVHESLEEAYAFASNQMFTYAFDRFQSRVMDSDYTKTYFGAAISNVYTRVGAFDDSLDSDLDLYSTTDYGTYAHYNASITSSSALSVSLSTKLGGTGSSNGTMYNLVSAHKYEINLNVAVPNTNPIVSSQGKPLDFVRMSKFRDAYVKVVLLQCDEDGYLANGKDLYRYNDESVLERCSPYTTVTNNIPAAFSNVRVVVDEENNVYSVYVDGSAAYYYDSATKTYKPYVNMTIPAPTGTGVDKTEETNADGELVYNFEGDVKKYHDYTAEFFETLVAAKAFGSNSSGVANTYSPACEYVRFFQAWTNFYLKDVAVSIIPDSDIEMIGVQDQIDADDNLALRFIAGIDDVFVPGIGYSVEAWHRVVQSDGTFGSWERTDRVQTENSRVVFRSIKETDANGKVDSYYAYNRQEGDYLSALKITDIPRDHGVNEQYKFTVTPYTLDADGNVDKTFESYTAIYNGAGEYLGNGQPFEVDLSEYKAFTESPNVILELKDGAGDYNDFYVYTRTSDPSGRYYIRYRLYYSHSEKLGNCTNTASNIRSFRIMTADIVKVTAIDQTAVTYTSVLPILGSGEISLAIKEYSYGVTSYQTEKDGNGGVIYQTETDADGNVVTDEKGNPVYKMDDCPAPHKIPVYVLDDEGNKIPEAYGNEVKDFIGGFHGDEHIKKDSEGNDMFSLVMDEREYVPGQDNLVVTGNEIVIEQTTLLDRWAEVAGSAGSVVEHAQTFTINKDGVDIDRTVTWLVDDFLIEDAYVMMLTLRRCTTETITNDDGSKTVRAVDPICEKVATYNADGTKIASVDSGADMNTNPGNSRLSSTQVREVRYSSDTSGAFAVAKFDMAEGSNGGFSAIRVDFRDGTAADNKLYVPMKATGGTGKVEETGKSYTKPSVNETWVLDTFFKLDYVNPNN